MTADQTANLARRLNEGLNGDADQRAAIQLIGTAARGVWLRKLDGWPEYLRPVDDPCRPHALRIDWRRLREGLDAGDRAWATFNDWAMATRADLTDWVHHLVELGGQGSQLDVAKVVWRHHEQGLRKNGNRFSAWQYDIRAAATRAQARHDGHQPCERSLAAGVT